MKTAVVTLCIGQKYENLANLTHPTLHKYADKIGADFKVISSRKFPQTSIVCYEKLQIRNLLDEYDRIIYLDTDIVVKDNCPNLFDIVPYGWFGAFSEGTWLDRSHAMYIGSIQFGFSADKLRELNKRYFNAGVMVADQTHRTVFIAPREFHNNFEDQTWMNIQVFHNTIKFVDIGPHFNRMPSIEWEGRHESFILHYAGGKFSDVPGDINHGNH